MPSASSDATLAASLLWAKKLEGDNAFLLERMKKLEAMLDKQDSRTRKVEEEAEACNALVCTVEVLRQEFEASTDNAQDLGFRNEVHQRLAEISTENESFKKTQQMVDKLVHQYRDIHASRDDASLLQERLTSLEEAFSEWKNKSGAQRGANDIKELSQRLEAFEAEILQVRSKDQETRQEFIALEAKCGEQADKIQALKLEVEHLKGTKAQDPPAQAQDQSQVQVPRSPEAEQGRASVLDKCVSQSLEAQYQRSTKQSLAARLSQQDAQIPRTCHGTQGTTQGTTQDDTQENYEPDVPLDINESSKSREADFGEATSRKKLKHSHDTQPARSKGCPQSTEIADNMTSLNAAESSVYDSTEQRIAAAPKVSVRKPNGRFTKAKAQGQGNKTRTSHRKPTSKPTCHITAVPAGTVINETTQFQPSYNTRNSLRKHSVYIELGPNGTLQPQPIVENIVSKRTFLVKASPSSTTVSATKPRRVLKTRPRRMPPTAED